jgi:ketosteroid isomerase-like protein
MKNDFAEVVASIFSVIDSCQWAKLPEHFHPDVQYLRPGYKPIVGLADLLDFYENRRIIKAGKHMIEAVCSSDRGNVISASGSFAGIDRHGNDLRTRFCDVYYMQDGKVKRRETFFDSPAV